MAKILELFTHRIVVIIALVIFVGPFYYFHLDGRIALFLIGLIFTMSGLGNIFGARKEKGTFFKGLGCFVGGLALSMGLLCMIGMVIYFIIGQRLDL
jgi:hypothetical protein